MAYLLFDLQDDHQRLWPLTLSRPSAELLIGMMTIREKWEYYLGAFDGYWSRPYLADQFPGPDNFDGWLINGAILPDEQVVNAIRLLREGEILVYQDCILAACVLNSGRSILASLDKLTKITYEHALKLIRHPWDLFALNGEAIRQDFLRKISNKKSAVVTDPFTHIYGDQLFIEPGATIMASVINTLSGPVYISEDAVVQEGSLIRGPFFLGKGSVLNMGAKMRGDSSIGAHCKIGGEVSNAIFFDYSNKGHDGFVGSSVIGSWCNLGADTNNSNLKNNYAMVKMWDYINNEMVNTGLQFCGLIMGDHSKSGINTMFNTGTTVGFGCNVYGSDFPPAHIPSFSWGGASGFETHKIEKFIETAERVMARRGKTVSLVDQRVFQDIFALTQSHRLSS